MLSKWVEAVRSFLQRHRWIVALRLPRRLDLGNHLLHALGRAEPGVTLGAQLLDLRP